MRLRALFTLYLWAVYVASIVMVIRADAVASTWVPLLVIGVGLSYATLDMARTYRP